MDVEIRGTVLYPMMTDKTIMNIRPMEKIAMNYSNKSVVHKHRVRAATFLSCDAATEIIDVERLSQKSNSVIHYANVGDTNGQLYCVDNPINASYWVKIITIAKDCQSNNVILMSTDRGVVLKTVRVITPGEPLLMWFNENILAMMNMPFLTPPNIQGQRGYICHVCKSSFEHPNPLKIHLALKCNQLDSSHLWNSLAKEFLAATNSSIAICRFSPSLAIPFKFELSMPSEYSPKKLVLDAEKLPKVETPDFLATPAKLSISTSSAETASMTSESTTSPHNSSTEISPIRSTTCRNIHQSSAFKPYVTKQKGFNTSHSDCQSVIPHDIYHSTPTPVPNIRTDMPHAAQMETIVSNLGKSKEGHYCIYCGKVYSRKYGLKIHIRTHTGYKPLKCKFCLRPFGDPSNLNKHVRLHADGETPYKCDLCGKVLVRRRDLERHMRSRHADNVDYVGNMSPESNA